MERTDLMLVLLAQQGDRAALNKLLESVQNRLFPYICRLLSNDATQSEDVLQETLLRIARKVSWLNDPRVFDAWAYRIASREVHRAMRRFGRTEMEDPLDADIAAPEVESPSMTWEELSLFIDGLSSATRGVIVLHYGEDLSLDAVAQILEIPLGTVKSRLGSGLKKLRELMKNHEP
jgi:RNA polymerase sigma-70 factor (ECF subfamily)